VSSEEFDEILENDIQTLLHKASRPGMVGGFQEEEDSDDDEDDGGGKVRALSSSGGRSRAVTGVGAVARRAAAIDLLKGIENLRNMQLDSLKDQTPKGRALFVEVFGGDCRRIARLHAILEAVMSTSYAQLDTRVPDCLEACESVEAVLIDMGLNWQLDKARQEEVQILTHPGQKRASLGNLVSTIKRVSLVDSEIGSCLRMAEPVADADSSEDEDESPQIEAAKGTHGDPAEIAEDEDGSPEIEGEDEVIAAAPAARKARKPTVKLEKRYSTRSHFLQETAGGDMKAVMTAPLTDWMKAPAAAGGDNEDSDSEYMMGKTKSGAAAWKEALEAEKLGAFSSAGGTANTLSIEALDDFLQMPDSLEASIINREDKNGVTWYKLKLFDGVEERYFNKRFSDFQELDVALRIDGINPPTLPSSGMVGLGIRHRLNLGSFNEDRQRDLERYLNEVLARFTRLLDSAALSKWFGNATSRRSVAAKSSRARSTPAKTRAATSA